MCSYLRFDLFRRCVETDEIRSGGLEEEEVNVWSRWSVVDAEFDFTD